jgi:hypothetical protein
MPRHTLRPQPITTYHNDVKQDSTSMAARNNPRIEKAHRERIATSQLLNRLNKIALGELQVDAIALRAIEIALRKTVPDLSAQELTLEHAQPFAVLPAVMDGEQTWEQAFTPGKTEH